MTEIAVRFDLEFGRRFFCGAGAVALMLCAVPELNSESVTLTTYYPAPSGAYTSVITTGDTILGRNTGTVAIGTDATPVGTRMTIMNGNVGIGNIAPTQLLDVTGTARLGSDTAGAVSFKTGGATVGLIRPSVTNGSILISDSTELATRGLTIRSVGNEGFVGIGVATPRLALEVHGETVIENALATAPQMTLP